MKVQVCTRVISCSFIFTMVASATLPRDEIVSSPECRVRFGYKYYFDHGTENCEQCREICQYAKIMRTVEQCETECPRYLTAMECADKEDQYYDEQLDTCSPCSELCDNHQVTGSTRICREQCSAYLDKLTPKQVPSLHKQNYLKAVDGSDWEGESGNSDLLLHPGWIAAISVGGVAFVCLIVVVIILYWTCSQQQKYGPAPQQDNDEGGAERQRNRRPVEETIQGSQDSQHFAIDAGSSGLPPTVSLSDLRDGSAHARDSSAPVETV